jgi:hypothetical protein
MKSNNSSSNLQIVPSNSGKHRQQISISQFSKRASLFGALLSLALLLVSVVPVAAQTVFFNNNNNQGVFNGVAPGYGTIVILPQPAGTVHYVITQIQTYHWDNGQGDRGPGTISVWLNTPHGRVPVAANNTFSVQVVPGSFGVPANWVANVNPPLVLNPGSYIIDDSNHATWSHNSGSAGCLYFAPSFQCGIVKVLGSLNVISQPVTGSGRTSFGTKPTISNNPASIDFGSVCTGSPVPAGFIVIDNGWSPFRCGSPTTLVDNVENIERFSDKPVGTFLDVCGFAPTPAGWVVVNQVWVPQSCGQPTSLVNNVNVIKRIS